mmetsp:Transcript_21525/g.43641  ORF Transcript_21525/g.43641 Transcript_21525/m.43641 type:complete len:202 (+) Transcript_21525:133-738(+)
MKSISLSICFAAILVASVHAQTCYEQELEFKVLPDCDSVKVKTGICAASEDEAKAQAESVEAVMGMVTEGEDAKEMCEELYEGLCGEGKVKATGCDVACRMMSATQSDTASAGGCKDGESCTVGEDTDAEDAEERPVCCDFMRSIAEDACSHSSEDIDYMITGARDTGGCADSDCAPATRTIASLAGILFMGIISLAAMKW